MKGIVFDWRLTSATCYSKVRKRNRVWHASSLSHKAMILFLVKAHYLKSVPGRKSDVSDCQWIQYLHSVGLLRASFRPPESICAIRTLWRHRGSLLEMAAEHILHMQKALSQLNLQLHHVLSDITGTSMPSSRANAIPSNWRNSVIVG